MTGNHRLYRETPSRRGKKQHAGGPTTPSPGMSRGPHGIGKPPFLAEPKSTVFGRSSGRFASLLLVAMLLSHLFSACGSNDEWYPQGSVTIEGYQETAGDFEKQCVIRYSIKNTGKSSISRSILSFSVTTDQTTYYKTVIDTTPVLAEKTIWQSVSIPYNNLEEAVREDGVKLLDAGFE